GWQYLTEATVAIPGIFGTGVDGNNNTLGGGQQDSHYTMSYSYSDSSGTHTGSLVPFVVNDANLPGTWAPIGAHSRWLSSAANASANPGTFTFQTSFDLTGFDPASVVLTGKWATDNGGIDILVNGHSTGLSSAKFRPLTSFSITGATNFFVPGVNTIAFEV